MLKAIKRQLLGSSSLPDNAPSFIRRALYQLRPTSTFAEFMGCVCATVTNAPSRLIGIEDRRKDKASSACPLHAIHPDYDTSPYYG
jgi:hypothetical protein